MKCIATVKEFQGTYAIGVFHGGQNAIHMFVEEDYIACISRCISESPRSGGWPPVRSRASRLPRGGQLFKGEAEIQRRNETKRWTEPCVRERGTNWRKKGLVEAKRGVFWLAARYQGKQQAEERRDRFQSVRGIRAERRRERREKKKRSTHHHPLGWTRRMRAIPYPWRSIVAHKAILSYLSP